MARGRQMQSMCFACVYILIKSSRLKQHFRRSHRPEVHARTHRRIRCTIYHRIIVHFSVAKECSGRMAIMQATLVVISAYFRSVTRVALSGLRRSGARRETWAPCCCRADVDVDTHSRTRPDRQSNHAHHSISLGRRNRSTPAL